jgi:hypothetical protein
MVSPAPGGDLGLLQLQGQRPQQSRPFTVRHRAAAGAEYRVGLKERQRLADEHPTVPDYRLDLGDGHDKLGLLLKDLGRPAEAEAEFRAALKEHQRLIENYPPARSSASTWL